MLIKEIALRVNTKETEYMLIKNCHNSGQNRKVDVSNKSFENVAQFKRLGTIQQIKNAFMKN
jgi:hypothetical protein